MVRVKRGVIVHKKHKSLLSSTRGYYGARSKNYKAAKQAYIKSGQYAYIHRKLKKRFFRRLWIIRINAFLRSIGLNYSQFIFLLKKKNILMNRKIISNMAIFLPDDLNKIINFIY